MERSNSYVIIVTRDFLTNNPFDMGHTHTHTHTYTLAHTQTHMHTHIHIHAHTNTKVILTTSKPLWQGQALYGKVRPQPPIDTREYILEKNHIHVINVIRFVPKELL